MSAEFSNTYQEILLDNLVSIIKQNFIFQTQIKLAENSIKNNEELKNKLDEITSAYNNVKSQLTQLDSYKIKAESNTSAHEEKNRIQAALNEELKKSSNLQKELDNKNNEIKKIENLKQQELNKLQVHVAELNVYIQKLEEIAPVTKLKKIKKEEKNILVFEEKNDTPKIENKIQKVLDGSAF